MMKKVTIRLAITLMLASLLISACSTFGMAPPPEQIIEINPNEGSTPAALTEQPTPTLRSTPTATALPAPGATEIPTPTNTLDPYATLLFDGVQLRYSQKFDEAIAKFSEAIKMNPNDPSGYIQRGITYSNVGKQDEAIADFNFAINYDPANADAYNGRGNAWAQKEQYEQAIKDYTKAMELQPALVKAYSNRAIAYINQQNIPQALVDFSKVIELTPDDAQAYFNRGQAYMTALQSVSDTSYVDLCIADFNQAIALSPDLAASYYLRGTCTGYKDDSASMFVDYSKAIELDPAQGKYYLFRAVLYPKAGTLDQALADAQKVLELTTDPEMITAAEQLIKELPTLPTLTPGPSPTPGS